MLQEPAEQLRQAKVDGGAFLLPPRLLLRLSGADAFRYLNGQITRDLGRMAAGHALQACILTPKGKLCAPLLIWRENDDLIVESAPSLEETLIARLERYIVADDVSVVVESEHSKSPTIHLFGKLAESEPWVSANGIRVDRVGIPGLDLNEDFPGVASLAMLDPLVIEALRIERAIPIWGSELSEETLPPEAGLDRTHIDYDRGCYPGQEVISRLKSIGRVNRLLILLTAPGNTPLASGHEIITEEGTVGSITSVAPKLTGADQAVLIYALASIKRNAAEGNSPLFALDPLTGGKTPLSILQVTGS
jgi:folate-binding protein YgfZ